MTTTEASQALSLNDVVAMRVRAWLRRFHLSPDWIIGLVGERGFGKSIGAANIGIRDWGMRGSKIFSNMKEKLTVNVPDEVAANYGLKGGDVVYEAEKMNRADFLSGDPRYNDGCIIIDEINLEYGEARRSNSNVNLDTDKFVQQLRKVRCGLIYTVIDEMFVDLRIRDNTDIFIMCKDTAAYSYNLAMKKPQGIDFEWMIYPMTWRLLGYENSYPKTHQGIGPIQIRMKNTWGIIDTYERQARDSRKYTDTGKELLPVELEESPKVTEARGRYGWIQDKVLQWKKMGVHSIERGELPLMLGRPATRDIKDWLGAFGVCWSNEAQAFLLNDFNLENQGVPLLNKT